MSRKMNRRRMHFNMHSGLHAGKRALLKDMGFMQRHVHGIYGLGTLFALQGNLLVAGKGSVTVSFSNSEVPQMRVSPTLRKATALSSPSPAVRRPTRCVHGNNTVDPAERVAGLGKLMCAMVFTSASGYGSVHLIHLLVCLGFFRAALSVLFRLSFHKVPRLHMQLNMLMATPSTPTPILLCLKHRPTRSPIVELCSKSE